jgi:hypothetical protein
VIVAVECPPAGGSTQPGGRVLEVKDSGYTDRFGRRVEQRAVLDIKPANEEATHVADLATAEALPAEAFDCVLLTLTLRARCRRSHPRRPRPR